MFSVRVKRIHHMNIPSRITGPRRVKVGFPAGSANVDKAVYNEFGTRGGASGGGWGGPIPERPFMRNTMRNKKNSYRDQLRRAAKMIVEGKISLQVVMSRLGIQAQNDIRDEITSLTSPPNSPVTIALKGSSKPLIDTGEMRQSVTYKVDG